MNKEIANRIRALRMNANFTQKYIAKELGITDGAYAKIERAETDPSASRLLQLASIFKVDVVTFFHDTKPDLKNTNTSANPEIELLTRNINMLHDEMINIRSELAALKKAIPKKNKT